eukprot:978394_1
MPFAILTMIAIFAMCCRGHNTTHKGLSNRLSVDVTVEGRAVVVTMNPEINLTEVETVVITINFEKLIGIKIISGGAVASVDITQMTFTHWPDDWSAQEDILQDVRKNLETQFKAKGFPSTRRWDDHSNETSFFKPHYITRRLKFERQSIVDAYERDLKREQERQSIVDAYERDLKREQERQSIVDAYERDAIMTGIRESGPHCTVDCDRRHNRCVHDWSASGFVGCKCLSESTYCDRRGWRYWIDCDSGSDKPNGCVVS